MTDQNQHKKDLFRELIRQGNIEKAPEGFADKVMAALESETEAVKAKWWTQSNSWMWGSIILGIASLVVVTFLIDFSFMGRIFEGIDLDGTRITQFITYMGNGFTNMIEGFSISSISIIVLITTPALIIFDRLLRRKPKAELNLL